MQPPLCLIQICYLRKDRNLGGIRPHAPFKDFLSIPVVHRDHRRVFVNLSMKNIAAVPLGHDAVHTHHFWIEPRLWAGTAWEGPAAVTIAAL